MPARPDFGWTPDWTRFEECPGWYHTMDSVIQAGSCTRTNQIDFDDEAVFAARQKLFDIARGKDRRPFRLVVSMSHPHDPYVIPDSYWNRYRTARSICRASRIASSTRTRIRAGCATSSG